LRQTVEYLLELLRRVAHAARWGAGLLRISAIAEINSLINPPFTVSSSQIVSSWLLSIMARSRLCDLVAVDVSGRERDGFTVCGSHRQHRQCPFLKSGHSGFQTWPLRLEAGQRQALEDFVRRQKKRLGIVEPAKEPKFRIT
jgi:hypothetical protein